MRQPGCELQPTEARTENEHSLHARNLSTGREVGSVTRVRRAVPLLTATALAAIGGLHVAWGRGSSFPFRNEHELIDSVVGGNAVPSPAACYAVAGALFVASGLVVDIPIGPRPVRKLGRLGVACVLGGRGALGLFGRTDLVSSVSTSEKFRRIDRRYLSPLCLALAAGAISPRSAS